jgi:aminoglycoside 6'-N-acetyltransferase
MGLVLHSVQRVIGSDRTGLDTLSGVILRGERVVLQPGEEGDVWRLRAILNEPEVASRWGRFREGEVADQFIGHEEAFVVTVDGEVVGAIQYGEEEDPMYRHAGIDIFLTASRHGQGLGTDAIRTLARYLFERRGHHRLSIDPAVDNEPAIRAYEAVGFRRVGVMRAYERGPDGTWHDGLLMDMLAGELQQPSAT